VRPTADRVREALFSALGTSVEGARVLDLFAGSGALGLEALSRGAAFAVFVDRAPPAVAALGRNVAALGAGAGCRILRREALAALAELGAAGERFDLMFLDPPYATDLVERALGGIAARGLLAPGGAVVVEHQRDRVPPAAADLRYRWTRRYGDSALTLFDAPDGTDPTEQEMEQP
jgi:16S rRNA (guanine(966)-N(2))-methyltransferase RsmD